MAVEDDQAKSWDIVNLEKPSGTLPALRTLLMATKSTISPLIQHIIDPIWRYLVSYHSLKTRLKHSLTS